MDENDLQTSENFCDSCRRWKYERRSERAVYFTAFGEPSDCGAGKNYNVKLFERLSQKLYITEEGERLLSYARHIIGSFEEMEKALREMESSPHLHIGCSVSVGTYLLNDLWDKIEEKYPGCRIVATVDNTSAIENQVLHNDLDLAIVEGIVKSEELVRIPVFQDELVLLCGKTHPFAKKKTITFRDLEGVNFISREKGSTERNQLERVMEEHDLSLNRCLNCTNTEAIKKAVMHGRGIAILSDMLVKKECESGDMIVLRLEDMHFVRQIHLIYHKNKYLSPVIRDVIRILENKKDG